jgi:hypothetical protein
MRSEQVGLDVLHLSLFPGAREISDSALLKGCCSPSPGVECATYEMKVKSWNMGTLNNRWQRS